MSEGLVAELRACLDALDGDQAIDGERIVGLIARLNTEGAALSPADLGFAVEVVAALMEQVRVQLGDLDGELRKSIEARRALRGYAHLRGHTKQQRLNRRA